MRRLVLAVAILAMLGVAADLVLLEHHEDWKQWIPLVLLGIAPAVLAAYGLSRAPVLLRVLRPLGFAFVIAGIVGIVLHYRGNAEFEREMYPSMSGFELVREALHGATPALAPGTMISIGLMLLVYLYRHPALERGEPTR